MGKGRLLATVAFALMSTQALAQEEFCEWAGAPWRTEWATPTGPAQSPLTLFVNADGDVIGFWGEEGAPLGEVWGHAIGPDGATIAGEWGVSQDGEPSGSFLLQLTRAPDGDADRCRFEGVWTAGVGDAPRFWSGRRAR